MAKNVTATTATVDTTAEPVIPIVEAELTNDEPTTVGSLEDEYGYFDSDEYIDPNAPLAKVIVINDKDDEKIGYFITEEMLVKSGWRIMPTPEQLHKHTFNSGKKEKGLLLQKVRMLVCQKSDPLVYDKVASKKEKRDVFVSLYPGKEQYEELKKSSSNGNGIGCKTFYWVYFLDENNNLLHDAPIEYRAKGVNAVRFNDARKEFNKALKNAYCASVKTRPGIDFNELFYSLGVLCFKVSVSMVAPLDDPNGDKSGVCDIKKEDIEIPTVENWRKYFIGGKSNLAQQTMVHSGFMPLQKAQAQAQLQPSNILPVLPAASNVAALEPAKA